MLDITAVFSPMKTRGCEISVRSHATLHISTVKTNSTFYLIVMSSESTEMWGESECLWKHCTLHQSAAP